jgi:hypothetical protein
MGSHRASLYLECLDGRDERRMACEGGQGAASSSRRQRHRSAWGASNGTKGRQARASLRARQTRAIGCNAGPAGGQQRSQTGSVGWRSGADAGSAARGRRGCRLAHRVDGGSPGKRATIPEQADGAPQMPPAGREEGRHVDGLPGVGLAAEGQAHRLGRGRHGQGDQGRKPGQRVGGCHAGGQSR